MIRNQTRALLLSSFLFALLTAANVAESEPGKEIAPGVRLVAWISDPRIVESSGVIASRRYSNVFWTHNDGGGPKKQVLYAIDREGNTLAAFQVIGPRFHDWEDIAIDDSGHLYLGDIGNNDSKENKLAVYEIDEPDPTSGTGSISPKRGWTLKFPGAPFDCESLFIWKDYGYVISKVFDNSARTGFPFSSRKDERAAHARTRRDDENRIASYGRRHFRRREPAWPRFESGGLCLSDRRRRGARI